MNQSDLFDRLANEYDQWFEDNPLILASEIEAVRQVTPTFTRAVEVGVGTGRFSEALGVPLGVEPSFGMARFAESRGITVVRGVAEALPFHDASFDTVFMITVDCYLESLAPAFSECYRILEPDGHLVIAHVDIDAPLGEVYRAEQDSDPFYRDAYFRGTREVLRALDDAGFEVQKIRQTVYSFEDILHEVRPGHGEGVFVTLLAKKR